MAFYGAKPPPLGDFLRRCQRWLRQSVQELGFGAAFRPYSLAQIHATVIGLERRPLSGFENRNLYAFRRCLREMRLPELFSFLVECDCFPFHAQFGGFENRDYPFQSRGARPYERSFSVQGRSAVMIAWPIRKEVWAGENVRLGAPTCSNTGAPTYPRVLEDLRRSAQTFNVLHRWHQKPTDVDNDLYLRLGILGHQLQDSQLDLLEDKMRRVMSVSPPMVVKLTVSDLSVVSYPSDDETLPESRSNVFQLTDPRLRDQDFVAHLYD